MNELKLTSSELKSPFSVVVFYEVIDDGFTLDFNLLSFVSPGKLMKKRGIGNRSYIIYSASASGNSSRFFRFSYPSALCHSAFSQAAILAPFHTQTKKKVSKRRTQSSYIESMSSSTGSASSLSSLYIISAG